MPNRQSMSISFKTESVIRLDSGRFLFAAISHVQNRLVMVGMHYFDEPIDYDSVMVLSAGRCLRFDKAIHADMEPCVVFSSEIGADSVDLDIVYRGQGWRVRPERQQMPSSRWSLMTLFKDDYELLPEFVRYYRSLGVGAFYLYYNGKLGDVDWTFLRTASGIDGAYIVLTEWDVPYWWSLRANGANATYNARGQQHHAQTMAINHYLHTAKGRSEYAFFVDLDEYVFTPGPVLEHYCRKGLSAILFQCWFAAGRDDSYRSFLSDPNAIICVKNWGEGPFRRMKGLVRLADVSIMGIHKPRVWFDRGKLILLNGLFHMRSSVSGPMRCSARSELVRDLLAENLTLARLGLNSDDYEIQLL